MDLGQAAEKLANNEHVMNHYDMYQNYRQRWFLSYNPNLLAAARKPNRFETWSDWDSFNMRQKLFILDQAKVSEVSFSRDKSTLKKLIHLGYEIGWKWSNLFPVFWGVEVNSTETTNTCNLFLGDALYLAGIDNLNSERKYFSARQIWNSNHPQLMLVREKEKAKRGDVAAFNGTHVEVLTRTYNDFFGRGSFCSRGGYRNPIGGEKCGSEIWNFFAADRLVNEESIRFFTPH